MYKSLLSEIEKPEVFKTSRNMFWQDPHIATHLLEAHLAPEHEGASRNPAFINQSVAWIHHNVAKKTSQSIIDFGCGPGLYCERLAQKGYQVTGVDFSQNSIDYAKQQAKKQGLDIRYRYENYLHVDLGEKFDVALLIYCDYGALNLGNRKRVLQTIWNHLKIGGRLILDVFTPTQFDGFQEMKSWDYKQEGGFWTAEPYMELNQNIKYKDHISLEQTTVITASSTETYYIWNQYFTKEMIQRELTDTGFSIIEFYNDVSGAPYQENNPTMAILVEKK
ncbi:class I SAM-dependent methyltransferase [Alkalihalobacillus pseudalcaliphilus]|uniref:class I SAM-dependent methyltransferase n=1 Tax=Alkalihalobacillus pseudalcaliphilus TaxID=79884 RepID=UPI00064DA8E8|nr:class I SAM-dependent methyltransferase [Alkalihalobacillus pseudalcaliphilus]KMK75192.1 SAM-dependent methyltransferase [Alkalihalobacillus pseudalcaliphilus]